MNTGPQSCQFLIWVFLSKRDANGLGQDWGSGHDKQLILQIKWFKTDSEMVLIDRFSPKTAPLTETTENGPC